MLYDDDDNDDDDDYDRRIYAICDMLKKITIQLHNFFS